MPPTRTDHRILRVNAHVQRHKYLSRISLLRAKLARELEFSEQRREALQTVIRATDRVFYRKPSKPNQRYEYKPAPYGHPLPFTTAAHARTPINYTGHVAYEPDGYGSDPERWKKSSYWAKRRAQGLRPLPRVQVLSNRRYYSALTTTTPQLQLSKEYDLDADTVRCYHNKLRLR